VQGQVRYQQVLLAQYILNSCSVRAAMPTMKKRLHTPL
jgi:hypothetical protein